MFNILILILGFSGIVAQILLLRELLVSFNGNELIIGVILANWLASEALGVSVVGRTIDRIKAKSGAFAVLALIFSASLTLAIYASRTFKGLFGILPGEAVSLPLSFLSSLIIIFPASFCHGAMFSAGCSINNEYGKNAATSIGNVYIWETIGTIIGGITLTYLLIPNFSSFETAFFIWILNLGIAFALLKYPYPKNSLYSVLAIFCLFSCVFFFVTPDYLQRISLHRQWEKAGLIDYRNSVYGNIVTTKKAEQYTFFYNGFPLISTPYPDISRAEELGHIPLLFSSCPKDMLIISNGVGGIIREALKHPIRSIDYAELDPLLIRTVKEHPSPLTVQELSDKRVGIINLDGRYFLRTQLRKYDLILIGITTPSDLSTNRLFTREFFVLAKSRLRNGGILTLTLPGSLTYYSQELKDLNASILNSLKGSYNFVRLIPGDYNIFIASDSAQILKVNAALISQRLIVQNINTNILTPPYLQYRLDKMWLDWFNSSISKAVKVSNQDLRPLAVFKMLLFWNKQFSPRFTRVLELAEKINLRAITIVISIFTLVLFYLFRSRKEPSRLCLAYSIATTGFFGMLANLLLTFSFQVFYGYLYRMIGLLVSVFMAGIAAGGIYISRNIGRLNNARRPLIILESIILFFTFLLAVAITNSAEILERLPLIFTLLFFIPGFLMGLEFSLVSRMYLGKRQEAGQVAGLLYAADLLGGWLAGILGGIILLPILGFYNACLIIVLLKASSLILLLVFKDVH